VGYVVEVEWQQEGWGGGNVLAEVGGEGEKAGNGATKVSESRCATPVAGGPEGSMGQWRAKAEAIPSATRGVLPCARRFDK